MGIGVGGLFFFVLLDNYVKDWLVEFFIRGVMNGLFMCWDDDFLF